MRFVPGLKSSDEFDNTTRRLAIIVGDWEKLEFDKHPIVLSFGRTYDHDVMFKVKSRIKTLSGDTFHITTKMHTSCELSVAIKRVQNIIEDSAVEMVRGQKS